MTQQALDAALALRRRAREVHRDIAASILAGGKSEPGRYRAAVATVEGMIFFAIHDDDTPDRKTVAVDRFSPREFDLE